MKTTRKPTQRTTTKWYHTKLDSKRRIVLRGARYEYYEVRENPNGSIVLVPKVLIDADSVSKRTLENMDAAMENLKRGKASEPLDLSEFRRRRPARQTVGIKHRRHEV